MACSCATFPGSLALHPCAQPYLRWQMLTELVDVNRAIEKDEIPKSRKRHGTEFELTPILEGSTALLCAVARKKIGVARHLVKAGALNLPRADGWSPLGYVPAQLLCCVLM